MKNLFSIFVVSSVVIVFFLLFGDDLFNNDDKNKELISEKDNVIGIWTSIKCESENVKNGKITEATIQFNSDGTCHYVTVIVSDTGSTRFETKHDGECYLNGSKDKIKMVSQDKTIINWGKISNDGNKIVTEECEFSKVG